QIKVECCLPKRVDAQNLEKLVTRSNDSRFFVFVNKRAVKMPEIRKAKVLSKMEKLLEDFYGPLLMTSRTGESITPPSIPASVDSILETTTEELNDSCCVEPISPPAVITKSLPAKPGQKRGLDEIVQKSTARVEQPHQLQKPQEPQPPPKKPKPMTEFFTPPDSELDALLSDGEDDLFGQVPMMLEESKMDEEPVVLDAVAWAEGKTFPESQEPVKIFCPKPSETSVDRKLSNVSKSGSVLVGGKILNKPLTAREMYEKETRRKIVSQRQNVSLYDLEKSVTEGWKALDQSQRSAYEEKSQLLANDFKSRVLKLKTNPLPPSPKITGYVQSFKREPVKTAELKMEVQFDLDAIRSHAPEVPKPDLGLQVIGQLQNGFWVVRSQRNIIALLNHHRFDFLLKQEEVCERMKTSPETSSRVELLAQLILAEQLNIHVPAAVCPSGNPCVVVLFAMLP
ncbi:unnamed protein product, partial [Notodromas monacha]